MINVGLPQVENSDDVVKTLSARGLLEFVDFSEVPDIGEWTDREIVTTGQGDHLISEAASKNPMTNAPFETVLTGEGVQSALASFNQDYGGQWQVTTKFSDEAGKILGDYTRNHLGKPLAIVLDGKVLSIPIIQAEISTEAVITGNFIEQDVKRLAVQLGGGALPFAMQAQRFRVSVLRGDFGMSSDWGLQK
jgi:preprotein translocase subunit SecD